MRAHLIVWAICLFVTGTLQTVVLAHEDTLITLKGTALVGLPAKYAPAEFDEKAFRLRVGGHAITLHPFLQTLFYFPHDLHISASWYHDPKILPPYILLRIQPKTRQFQYEILFNLESLKLIHVEIRLEHEDRSTQNLELAIPGEVRKSMDASVETAK